MHRVLRFALGFALLVAPASCGESTKPDPASPEKDQSVTFTLTKMDALGDCDQWDCEATAGSGKSDFKGTVKLKPSAGTEQTYSVDWGNAGGTKEVGKSFTFTVKKGGSVSLSTSGLRDEDPTSGDEELSGDMKKTFYYPIKNYADLSFDCHHHEPSDKCYCALRFHWNVSAAYVD